MTSPIYNEKFCSNQSDRNKQLGKVSLVKNLKVFTSWIFGCIIVPIKIFVSFSTHYYYLYQKNCAVLVFKSLDIPWRSKA